MNEELPGVSVDISAVVNKEQVSTNKPSTLDRFIIFAEQLGRRAEQWNLKQRQITSERNRQTGLEVRQATQDMITSSKEK